MFMAIVPENQSTVRALSCIEPHRPTAQGREVSSRTDGTLAVRSCPQLESRNQSGEPSERLKHVCS